MLQAGNAIQGLLLHPSDAGDGVGVAGTAAEARRFGQRKSSEFNGACEILYVTGLTVIAPGDHLRADAGRYAWYGSLALLAALATVWLLRPPLAE